MTPTDELIAAPVGEWETTGEQRKAAERHWPVLNSVEFKDECGDGFWLRLLRDLDRALASLSAERAARKEADRIGAMKAEQYAAERDQNKRLVEAGQEAMAWVEECNRVWIQGWRRDQSERAKAIDAALAQPEEQR